MRARANGKRTWKAELVLVLEYCTVTTGIQYLFFKKTSIKSISR